MRTNDVCGSVCFKTWKPDSLLLLSVQPRLIDVASWLLICNLVGANGGVGSGNVEKVTCDGAQPEALQARTSAVYCVFGARPVKLAFGAVVVLNSCNAPLPWRSHTSNVC